MDNEPIRITSETMQQIKEETAKDSVPASLCDVAASGWPAERKETPEHLRVGVSETRSLFTMAWPIALIKLSSLPRYVGVDSNTRRARECLFWPRMKAAIKENAFHVDFVPDMLASDHKNG